MSIGGRSFGSRVGGAALVCALALVGSVAAQTVQNPRRIAAGPNELILVADRRHRAIIAVDQETLETAWSFALPDEGAPFGLAATGRYLYIGNTKTMNVEVYRTPHGNPGSGPDIKFEYNLGHTTGLVGNPIAIDVDRKSRRVFVLDGADKQVNVAR
ncbi:MAG: hypothetical protein OES25_16170 [Acidobacteriota bacterium]|nr:hypothetical protein [Acidobacteriota bacterium]